MEKTWSLQLYQNEGLVLQHENVYHNNKPAALFLTTQRLVCREDKIGIFKTTHTCFEFPLEKVKVIDNQAQTMIIKSDSGWKLQIDTFDGIEVFDFPCSFYERLKVKAELDEWEDKINYLLTGNLKVKRNDTSLVGNIKKTLGSLGIITNKPEKPEYATIECSGCGAKLTGIRGNVITCDYCGTKQTIA